MVKKERKMTAVIFSLPPHLAEKEKNDRGHFSLSLHLTTVIFPFLFTWQRSIIPARIYSGLDVSQNRRFTRFLDFWMSFPKKSIFSW